MNLWSRFGNILYYVIEQEREVKDFDSFFDILYDISWEKYIPDGAEVNIKATSIKSEL